MSRTVVAPWLAVVLLFIVCELRLFHLDPELKSCIAPPCCCPACFGRYALIYIANQVRSSPQAGMCWCRRAGLFTFCAAFLSLPLCQVPAVLIKASAPYWFHLVPYDVRMAIVFFSTALCFPLVTYGGSVRRCHTRADNLDCYGWPRTIRHRPPVAVAPLRAFFVATLLFASP